VVLALFLGAGLKLNPREVPSPLIGKPAPEFKLPLLHDPGHVSREDLLGKVWILNVWASWCVACREEHPLLVEFAAQARC
jgi:cytochrome c biogenesis protein CcmG/thiol:disulfide interchange protein DsbE